MKCLRMKIYNIIHDFFHPSVESVMEKFAIVEKRNITEKEATDLLKILEEWYKKA